ncbi:MAG TPA: Fur family transcriptional regulator [Candidatus Sulfotelmatobacter sp.]|nr:Fur family transcriptional regulator [Candidatus Sulfotelmatobacter sp.]
MSQKDNDIATVLRKNGLKVTKQRLLVFETLEKCEPVTMNELYDLVKGQLDRASLYRIITAFEELSIVSRINIGWKYKIELSDAFSEHHHHLTCIRCGKIVPINEEELEGFIDSLTLSHKFKPTEHQIEVQGYCEACSSKKQ